MQDLHGRAGIPSLLLTLLGMTLPACGGGGEVDPTLVGTWQLRWAGQPVYWEIRADGSHTVSGPGAQLPDSGSFTAAGGQWSISSAVWGEDGGSYSLTDPDTFVGVGRLGPGTWQRATGPMADAAPVAMQTEADGARLLAKDIPELMLAATQRARQWRADAIPVSLEFAHRDLWNYKGPEVKIAFSSPAEGTGLTLTYTNDGVRSFEHNQAVNWGAVCLPPVFADLPAATRIARENGLMGPLDRASLRIYAPGGTSPVLAWMMHTGATGGGRTINGATGEIIDYDVTGYIADYNAQWEQAAQGLRALMRSGRPSGPVTDDSSFTTIGGDSSSSEPYVDPYDPEAYQKSVAEAAAYWGGSAEDYNRIKNGECTWSDSSSYGC